MSSHGAYKAEQLSVFLENRAGRLSEAVHALADAGVNLRGISLGDTADFGILRMMVSDVARADAALNALGLTTGKTVVVGVELADEPGSLDSILQMLSAADVNVEYMYALAWPTPHKIAMIFRFDKADAAITALAEVRAVRLIPAGDLA